MSGTEHVARPSARAQAALSALLAEVARAADGADSLEEACRLTLVAVCRATSWPVGHLCLPAVDEPGVLVSTDVWVSEGGWDGAGDPAALRAAGGGRLAAGSGPAAAVMAGGEPVWLPDARDAVGVGAAFAFAVPGRDGVAAVLEFLGPRPRPVDRALLRAVTGIGAQLGRVADRVHIQRELQAGTRRLERIIETSVEAFVSIDADGLITGWNAAAEAMFDLPRALALGRPLAETIIPPGSREAHHHGLRRFLGTGEKRVIGARIEISAWRPDTGEIPVEMAVWALREGGRWTFNAFLHDIRHRRQGQEALREAYQREKANAVRLRSLDQAKDDFIATVSHELRTPLTSLTGYLELLLDGDAGPVPAHQERMLRTMSRNAGRLQALIEDLLLINQMDAGSLRLALRPTSLPRVVARAVHAVTPLAEARHQRFEVELEPVVDAVPADPVQLERALRALLSNAVKFGPDGGLVRVAGRRLTDTVELAVTDQGYGIDPDDVPRLFDRFYRTGEAVHRVVQGAGLGLTIARRIVEEHGGSIAVASVPGRGATFTVTLPG